MDAGLSCRELLKRMQMAGENPADIDALLITHEHQDHVQGVAVLARKLGVPVYFTPATHRAWMRWMMPHKRMTYASWLALRKQDLAQTPATASVAEEICADEDPPHPRTLLPHRLPWQRRRIPAGSPEWNTSQPAADSGSATLPSRPFTIPHDAVDPVGFVFEVDGVRMAIATDLGYMPPNVKMAIRNCDVLMLESNHDLEMLRDGPYPWSVKQRVMSRVGHLSNEAASDFLEKNYDGNASYVVLAHLSECNNLPELARVTAERALRDRMSLLANKLLLAQQHAPLEPICL